jgi:pimeloyl-ACP methyl ester carboxylesterase
MPLIEKLAVDIPSGRVHLPGDLELPDTASGVVVFAHGSGSSRFSPRNRQVAAALRAAGMGTLLIDLLTATEESEDAVTGRFRFDIARLAERLGCAAAWLAADPRTRRLPLGYFGASTGAAAAIQAAVDRPGAVRAIVSRGGRPDLADGALDRLQTPLLLIVGGEDVRVLGLNRGAFARVGAPRQLAVVPGATHLFEEPGALDQVARLAGDWFAVHLTGGGPARGTARPPSAC